jgi:hypothetical protein
MRLSLPRPLEIATLVVAALSGAFGAALDWRLGAPTASFVLGALAAVAFASGGAMVWRAVSAIGDGRKASRDLARNSREVVQSYLVAELRRVLVVGVAHMLAAAVAGACAAALKDTPVREFTRSTELAYCGSVGIAVMLVAFVSLGRVVLSASTFLTQIDDAVREERLRAEQIGALADGRASVEALADDPRFGPYPRIATRT